MPKQLARNAGFGKLQGCIGEVMMKLLKSEIDRIFGLSESANAKDRN